MMIFKEKTFNWQSSFPTMRKMPIRLTFVLFAQVIELSYKCLDTDHRKCSEFFLHRIKEGSKKFSKPEALAAGRKTRNPSQDRFCIAMMFLASQTCKWTDIATVLQCSSSTDVQPILSPIELQKLRLQQQFQVTKPLCLQIKGGNLADTNALALGRYTDALKANIVIMIICPEDHGMAI